MTEWWTAQTGTMLGAFGGAGVGIVGGCLGAAIGVLAPRGKAKGVIVPLHVALVALGLVGLAAGIVAVVMGQPYHVWYPLVLGGAILSTVLGSLLPIVILRYRQADHRRLSAEELRRG